LTGNIVTGEGQIMKENIEFKDILDAYSIKVGTIANFVVALFFIAMCGRYYLEW
jgi:hypothetical protein